MKYFLTLIVLACFAGAIFGFYQFKPEPKRKKSAPIIPAVQTTVLRPDDHAITLKSFGTIVPEKELTIVSEVQGRIIEKNPELVPGGFINEGDTIAQIDQSNYRLLVRDRRATVVQAENALELESGNQKIAQQEYELFKEELITTEQGKRLVLRQPQLRQAQARLDGAKSKLEEAELDLARTTIRSPFNALVLEHFVEAGKYVATHAPIARLVETDRFWVSLSVPITALPSIDIPTEHDGTGSAVHLTVQADNGSGLRKRAHVVKLRGTISNENRMAQLIAAVDDPLDLGNENPDGFSRLLLGSYVTAEIDCGILPGVYRIPRSALHEQDTIWLLENARLRIVPVEILWSEDEAVLVGGDLDGKQLITSRIQNPLDGMALNQKEARTPGKGGLAKQSGNQQ